MALKVGELFVSLGLDSGNFDKGLNKSKGSMLAASAAVAGAVAAMYKAGKSIYEAGTLYDDTMAKVQAITQASADEMTQLKDLTADLGTTTRYSADQVGEAMTYMGMAGWKTNQILAGTAPILDLATASGEDLSRVSDIVTDGLTAFGMSAEETVRFVDTLAQASRSSNTNVELMGESFKYAGALAGTLGYSIEDVALAVGLMANAGVKGSQAGTALRNAFTRLSAPNNKQKKLLNELGVETAKSTGEMLPLIDVLDNLREGFGNLTDEQLKADYAKTLFGEESLSGMLAVINASEDDYKNLKTAIQNSEGAATSMADIMGGTLGAAVDKLKAKFKTLEETKLWPILEKQLTPVVEKVNEFIDTLAGMDDETVESIIKVTESIGGLLISIVGFALMSKIFAAAGTAISALTSPIGLLAAAFLVLYTNCKPFREFVNWAVSEGLSGLGSAFDAVSDVIETVISTIDTAIEKLKKFFNIQNPKDMPDPLDGYDIDSVLGMGASLSGGGGQFESGAGAGRKFAESMASGVNEAAEDVSTAATTAVDNAGSEAESEGGAAGQSAGSWFAQAVANGIDSSANTAVSAAKNMMKRIADALKTKLPTVSIPTPRIGGGGSFSGGGAGRGNSGFNIDYNALGTAVAKASSSQPITLSVNGRQIASVLAEDNSSAINSYTSRINAGYGRR